MERLTLMVEPEARPSIVIGTSTMPRFRIASLSSCALSDTPTRATARGGEEPTRSTLRLAQVRQTRTPVANPACRPSLD